MHGIAALQELVNGYDDALTKLKSVNNEMTFKEEELQRLKSFLSVEV